MADDLIDMYLGSGSKSTAAKEPVATGDGSLMDMYLGPSSALPAPTAKITVRPVTIGNREYSPEEMSGNGPANVIGNPDYKEPTNSLGSAISGSADNIWKNIKQNYQSGVDTGVSGINDLETNRPASGIGKIVLGGLGVVTSPITGPISSMEEGITQLTGSPEIGQKAGLLASALPVSPIGLMANAARPVNRAITDIVNRVGTENIPEVINRLKSNPRLTLMDVSIPVKTDVQGLASTPGAPQVHLENFVKDRTKGERGVVEQAYNDVMGPAPNVKQILDDISAEAKKTGKTLINPALKAAGPVDIGPVLQHIEGRSKPGINAVVSAGEPLPDDAIIRGLKGVRKYLTNDKQQLTDPTRLHNIQSALRSKAENLLSSSNGQDRLMGYEMMNVRNKLVDAIDIASGPADTKTGLGPYKTGLSKYRNDKAIGDALEEGTKVLKNGGLETRPEFLEAKLNNMNDAEKKAFKIGARIAVDNQIRGMRFAARRGEAIPDVEFNAEKLGMLFGKNEVANMQRVLNDERDIHDTHQKLFQNSQTASRLAGQQSRQIREPITISQAAKNALPFALLEAASSYQGLPLIGTTAALTLGGGRKLANMAGRGLDRQTNLEYTKLASATGQAREELIKTLENLLPIAKPSILNRISTSASKLPLVRP